MLDLSLVFANRPQAIVSRRTEYSDWLLVNERKSFVRPASSEVAERTTAETEWAAIEHLGSGTYGNFTTSTGPGWVSTMYPPAWDPSNLFSRNHNVVPD